MIVIMDDVVENLSTFQDYALSFKENKNEKWYSLNENHDFTDFCQQMLSVANAYFDLSKCIGYEFWTHNDTIPKTWHLDKVEQLKLKQGITRFPLCSMVYYVMVDNLRGGKLHIEDEIITPKTNRLVIFSPGKYHCVEPFIGSRTTYCVNPWDVKL